MNIKETIKKNKYLILGVTIGAILGAIVGRLIIYLFGG